MDLLLAGQKNNNTLSQKLSEKIINAYIHLYVGNAQVMVEEGNSV